ncbi:MAG: glycoside hydrolase family 19 protein [Devosia sp.]
MPFNRAVLLAKLDPMFLDSYKEAQTEGLNAILVEWEARKPKGDLRWLAYMLATAFHETNQQMQPVREAYWVKNAEAWRKAHLPYYPYYGRGYVQLTHFGNYKKAGDVVGQDLVSAPDKALDAGIAAAIMFVGMEKGWFRGDAKRHDLARYFSSTADDPVGARAIINGKEYKEVAGGQVLLATIIAQYHEAFLDALEHSRK